jgi:glycosyltransferase involved in cell wall biosynthesis
VTTQPSLSDCRAVIYGAALGSRGGTGVYLSRLLAGFAELDAPGIRVTVRGGLMSPRDALSMDRIAGGFAKAVDEFLLSPRAASSARGAPVHLPAFSGRPPSGSPVVLTLHDLAFMAHPAWFPLLKGLYYRLHFPRVARRADLVMADSSFTAGEAVRFLDLSPSRLRVVPLSPGRKLRGSASRARARFCGGAPYVLSVSTVEPRKNIPALIEAWRGVAAVRPELRLLVVGRWGWGPRSTRELLEKTPGVEWVGALDEDGLADAYAGAELLVYPSLYEGFGLPPLEAAQAGIPSVLGPAGALKEIYSESGARFCGAAPDSIRDALLETLETPADPEALREFAGRFSDQGMARAAANIYTEVAG